MKPKVLGTILIGVGLLFLALQMEGIYRNITLLLMGLAGILLWWKVNQAQLLLALSLTALALAASRQFALMESVKMILLSAAFLIPWLIQGRSARSHWTLILAIIFAVNALVSWRGPWLIIQADGAWAPLTIGLAFIVVYVFARRLGFLIPGTILSAIGIVSLLPASVHRSWMVFLGLGLAFASVWLFHTRTRGSGWGERFWPLFPAGAFLVMTLAVGLAEGFSQDMFLPIFLGMPALVLLTVYGFKRNLGLLIPGLMLGSVALWFAVGTELLSPLLFFLAASFVIILILETRKCSAPLERLWPLIPALILATNGLMLLLSEERDTVVYENFSAVAFGLVFIGVGILVLFGREKKE